MRVNWNDLLGALAILCILEGVMPFMHPLGTKRLMTKLSKMAERELRLAGFFSILAGLLILFVVRS
jgi:uncharacterized protein YjeT (DUF2065 family)